MASSLQSTRGYRCQHSALGLPYKVVRARDLYLTPELGLGRELLVLQDLVDRHLVALAVGVDLRCHLVSEEVELAPGELDVGEGEDSWT